jgi:hypothetical protein
MLWFFVVIPLFVLAAIVLSSTCVWILTIRRRRQDKTIVAGQTPEPRVTNSVKQTQFPRRSNEPNFCFTKGLRK